MLLILPYNFFIFNFFNSTNLNPIIELSIRKVGHLKKISKLFVFILVLLTAKSLSFSQQKSDNSGCPMTFMIMISSPNEEKAAGFLIKSLRTYGGVYSSAPVILVISDSTKVQGKTLTNEVEKIINLKIDERLRQFPFTDKVYACAEVEQMVADKTDWLVWLNPDVLILAPPTAITADKDAWASLRPVHIQNVGCYADAPVPEYWKRIYKVTGLDTDKVWTVNSLVDNKKIRGYFNSGFMAFNPAKGILREWKNAYVKLLSDTANYSFYTSDQNFAIFCHQAVLSSVVMAKAGKQGVNILPASYGYPLGLQDQEGFINKIDSASNLVAVITGGYGNLKKIKISDSLKSWLETNIK
jgi:hypothetical protein